MNGLNGVSSFFNLLSFFPPFFFFFCFILPNVDIDRLVKGRLTWNEQTTEEEMKPHGFLLSLLLCFSQTMCSFSNCFYALPSNFTFLPLSQITFHQHLFPSLSFSFSFFFCVSVFLALLSFDTLSLTLLLFSSPSLSRNTGLPPNK